MRFDNPLRSVAPSVDADVLAVLAGTHLPLTGATVQKLAGRSYAQVREVLRRLARTGLVKSERHGNTIVHHLNRDHVLAGAVVEMARAADGVETRTGALASGWDPAPAAVVVFGSFARRDGGENSDIDLLLVRPDPVDPEDRRWTAQRYELARQVESWTGNVVQVVELSTAELAEAAERGDALVAAVQRDGRVVAGPRLRDLLAAASGATA